MSKRVVKELRRHAAELERRRRIHAERISEQPSRYRIITCFWAHFNWSQGHRRNQWPARFSFEAYHEFLDLATQCRRKIHNGQSS